MADKLHSTKLVVSFAAIYLIWGTTYLAMRVAVETIPPFLMASGRFFVAGGALFAIMRLRGIAMPTWAQWKSALIVGMFLFVGGNGLVTWAEQEIPSGVAALVISTMPLWMTIFDWLLFGGPKPTGRIALGIALGLAGTVLLIGPADLFFTGESRFNMTYMIGLVLAPIFWSIGSLYSRRANLPQNVFMANASEMLCGAVVLALISILFGEPGSYSMAATEPKAWFAVAYLIVFGAMIALSAYAWLLKNTSASKVSTYSYVNPVIAVFLGWLILSEPVGAQTFAAVLVILVGVVIVVTDKNLRQTQKGRLPSRQAKPETAESVCIVD